jgi:type II secretory pathway pseudopilin PulG
MRMNSERFLPLRESGFTLVELLVSTALGLAVIGGFLSFSRFQLFAMQDQSKQIDLQSTVRATAQLFADEIRRAGADPQCVKTFEGLPIAGKNLIYMRADVDGSGTLGGQSEEVLYFFNDDNDKFYRFSQGKLETLVEGGEISGTRFRYFDAAGLEIPTTSALGAFERAQIRRIRLELNVKAKAKDPNRTQPVVASAAAEVDLRNRFFLGSTACP